MVAPLASVIVPTWNGARLLPACLDSLVSQTYPLLEVIVAVDRLPQRLLAAAIEKLPVSLHGAIGGSTVAETTFIGQAGQKVGHWRLLHETHE